ncbi:Qb-SNARE, VTI1-family [Volvox carteri f. nagariensis]|uniref:Qb-SNARE, VTI1-family n=1 Tax=Volvox carteri f. nagariensis TaxID=3068 RepID=D8TSD7_VOLCA|nr:Qb-SNARE, VTI1-family [Volvox carteri f. nagariensis]EFJ49805.1 Qb-SNARE, VTI1-family [Volvox carteri f. nagariensis]|eukprot:XP_002949312.1 Qb-SNARE, VTI1-family [Volvox carteri f. nagariensis]
MDDTNALFHQYENEYCNKSTDISRKINSAITLSGETKRKKLVEVDADIKEADNIIKKMDMEARSVAPERSKQLQNKVKEYKADLASLREQLTKARTAAGSEYDAARAELSQNISQGLGIDYASSSQAQRDRMLSASAKLEQSNDRLQTGKKLLAETEELGSGILANLAAQREVIIHSRDTLHGADDNISKARKILSNMSRRMLQNKLIMFGIIGFLLAGIIIIIYFKVK